MSKQTLVFTIAPPDDVVVELETADGVRRPLRIRPFTVLDEKWLAEFLGDRDIFGLKDNDPRRAAGIFYRQLRPESQEVFAAHISLPKTDNLEEIGEHICGRLGAHNLSPLVAALMDARVKSLPEMPESRSDRREKHRELGKSVLTGMLLFAFGCMVGWGSATYLG